MKHLFSKAALPGWALLLLSQLKWLYALVDAWSNVEFITDKIRNVPPLAIPIRLLASAWFQIVLIAVGLGWIALANSSRARRWAWFGVSASRGQINVKRKVLWVDDYPTNNERLIKAYHGRGVAFDLVLDNDEAIGRLQRENYDLVITDMGRGSAKEAGLWLLRQLRRFPSPPPVIVFSGVPPGDYRHDAAVEEGAMLVTHDPRALELKINELLALDESRSR